MITDSLTDLRPLRAYMYVGCLYIFEQKITKWTEDQLKFIKIRTAVRNYGPVL